MWIIKLIQLKYAYDSQYKLHIQLENGIIIHLMTWPSNIKYKTLR